MAQVNDLSRSLVSFEQSSTLVVVLEMSQSSWLAAGVVPGVERRPLNCCIWWGGGGIRR